MRESLSALSTSKYFLLGVAFERQGVVDGGGEFLRIMGYYDEGLLRIQAEGLYYFHYKGAAPAVQSVKGFVKNE